MRHAAKLGLVSLTLVVAPVALAEDAAPLAALGSLPIREVSVFKDGHAFVLREGSMPVDAAGNVLLDDLPSPVLGTFWPYSADGAAKLTGVVAGRRRVAVERTALGVAELLRANVGAEATFQETNGTRWPGKIVSFPGRSSAEVAATSAPGAGEPLPVQGELMIVETAEGTRAVPIARIADVTFKSGVKTAVRTEEYRDLITMQLAWNGARAEKAKVGMMYLERGLRWVPEYRIDVDGAGKAHVKLEATLVNDLADLDHAAVHLVVGMPKFDFKDMTDPMSLGAGFAATAAAMRGDSRFANFASNAIQTQVLSNGGYDASATASRGGGAADAVSGAAANEDLFVFDLADVSLRRGERMTLSVAEYDVKYADVYTIDVPMAPPSELWQRGPAEADRMRALLRPSAMHKIRLDNESPFPLTTAPAIVLRAGRLLGQGSTVYTPVCGRCDVAVTNAIGLRVKKDEVETARTPDAVRDKWRNESYNRIDLDGSLSLSNDTDRPYDVEVTRDVLGAVDSAGQGGKAAAINIFEDAAAIGTSLSPAWWGWFNWPSWWHRMNGAGRISWKVTVAPHTTTTLGYEWHYLWQ